MEDKIRTTIYLDRSILELTRMETENLSQTISTLLKTWIGANSLEETDKKIKDYQMKLKQLEKRKKELLKEGVKENKHIAMKEDTKEDLFKQFKIRFENPNIPFNHDANRMWINSPKNKEKCKIIGERPEKVLEEMEGRIEK